jgi:DNA-binding SARP family transcriptional activator/energy-coupling factor transporter ATP-binding protein EcfA2
MSLEIFLLGQFKLTANNTPLELPSRPAQSLLAYLALNAGATLRREKLASLLWGEATESNARSYLRQALWRIRKYLESASLRWEDYLQISEISVTFNNQADYWLDVDQLLKPTQGQSIEEIIDDIDLYRGELLPGFYDEWVTLERDRLQAAFHQKMDHLLERLIQVRRWDEVLKWGEQWIRYGFSTEPAYRALMQAYAGMGNRGMVGITYQRCREALSRDLGVEPSPETTRLYKQLQRAELQELELPSSPTLELGKQPAFFFDERASQRIERPVVVARERELERLDHALNQVLQGQGKVIFVTGEAGSGKTTLVTEFARRSLSTYGDLIVVSGNCNAHTGVGDPYLPFREILELLTGDVQARWLAGAITKEYAQFLWNLIPFSVQALVDAGPELVDTFIPGKAIFERAAAYASGEENWLSHLDRFLKRRLVDPIARNPHQSDLFIQYNKVLQILARRAPMVLILDDLQWADLGSISLLFHLGRYLAGNRILILGAYRPEEIALGRAGERHPLESVVNELQRVFGKIEVNLDQTEGRAYIDELLDSEPNQLSPQFREMLSRLTRGQPLFTIELLRGMQERGDLVKDGTDRWVEGPTLDWENLPARVEAVIAERIGRLDPALQATLRTASIEGEIFTVEVVARVQSCQEAEILNYLSNELDRKHHLVRAHSIQRVDGQLLSSYRFRHILVQKFLYSSMDEVERVYLHEQIGTTLEDLYAHQLASGVIAPQLARHFQEARSVEKAVHYLHLSGARALSVSAYQEATVHLKQGLVLLATLPDPNQNIQAELLLTLDLSKAAHLAKGFTDLAGERSAIRALELSQQVGTVTQLCQTLGTRSVYCFVKGEYQAAHDHAERLLNLGQQVGDPLLSGMGHWLLGIIGFVQGEYLESRQHLEQIVSFYDAQKHHCDFVFLRGVDVGLSAMAYLACCLWCLGYPEQAVHISQEAINLSYEIKHAFTLADVLRYGCCELHTFRRDGESLKVSAEELIHLAQEKEFPAWLFAGEYSLGEALILLGQTEAGIAIAQEAVRAELATSVRVSTPGPLCYVAEAYAGLGELEQGLNTWNEAMAIVEQTGEHHWQAELYRVLSMLQLLQGDEEEAEASLKKGLEVARQQQARSWELRVALALARLWRKQGKVDEGRQLVKEIYSWFTEGFDTPDLIDARELCKEE